MLVRKGASKETIENALAAANFSAAPYDTKERMLVERHHRRPARVRPGLHLHQRTRSAVRGAQL
ncbi:hypothetical protein ACFU3E_23605 [Streptomyces sp. NPDC057424]|uniref:hypothetical protein n=1 Tax=Streptomyces sp. NPDC057424 TaxID=3346127 RepID=UPI0036CFE22D